MTDKPDFNDFECLECGRVSDIHEQRADHDGVIRDGFFMECEHCRTEFYIRLAEYGDIYRHKAEYEIGDKVAVDWGDRENIEDRHTHTITRRYWDIDSQEFCYELARYPDIEGGAPHEVTSEEDLDERYIIVDSDE
jgi:hypothetical protein